MAKGHRAVQPSNVTGRIGAMTTTMDRTGRVTIPKRPPEELRITPGPVEFVADEAEVRLTVPPTGRLTRQGRFLGLEDAGEPLDVDVIRDLRLGLQR